ncbi:Uma2 family endonuclease [Roseofilum sp. BLCC_M154]|uniref:Uma2 family endonuclease n=1 Tax=Roseofilum acuticapitatum BLCC-M154 TaxID=3022444 RepID=A0ABT7AWB3_9CYAN|nr:Uma2 family endonuclease [Roseofilum acuticapitatum]MDJ1170333.1 Uma2 family endonuclease [Roseofilum acuticapitatum BLCC-M154]
MSVLLKRLFTVDEYHRMGTTGILPESDRTELIRGEIIQKSRITPIHASYVDRLTRLFLLQLGERVWVRGQNTIVLDNTSEPEPDLCLLRPRADFYRDGHPQPEDIFLLVEVADTTLRGDRDIKIPLYAQAQIPEVWLLNIPEQCLEIYRQPAPEGYQQVQRLQKGEISVQLFPDIQFAVAEILA